MIRKIDEPIIEILEAAVGGCRQHHLWRTGIMPERKLFSVLDTTV